MMAEKPCQRAYARNVFRLGYCYATVKMKQKEKPLASVKAVGELL